MIDSNLLKRILLESPRRRGSVKRQYVPPATERICALIGPRRAGKTHLLFQIIDNLAEEGIDKSRIVYINFEDERLSLMDVGDLDKILETYFSLFPENKSKEIHLMFDEIQNVPGWQKYLRRIYDKENARLYVTGSSAKLLSREIATELRGRTLSHIVLPFSFKEYLLANKVETGSRSSYDEKRFLIQKLFDEYVRRGGFPETLGKGKFMRCSILQDYFESVVFRDVVERYDIKNVDAVKILFRQLASTFARPFSVNKIYNQLKSMNMQVSKDFLYSAASHIEESMYFFFVPIHSDSPRIRAVNPKKAYIVDNGLPDCLIMSGNADIGWLYENAVAIELIRHGYELTYFKKNQECDFIVFDRVSRDFHAIQVTLEPDISREKEGLLEAMDDLSLKHGTIICSDVDKKETIKGKIIYFVPLWKWLIYDKKFPYQKERN